MIANGIADYIAGQGIATLRTELFVSRMPDSPDNAICVFDEPGTSLPEHQDYDSDSFGSMIMVRGDYSFVKEKLIAIHRAVPALSGTYDDIRIIDTKIQTEPAYIEVDEKGRRVYTVHYEHYCNLGNSTNRISNYNP